MLGQAPERGEVDRLLQGQCGFGDDIEQPLRGVAVVGGGVGDGVPAEDEDVGVAAGVGDPGLTFVAAGLVGNGKARAGRRAVVVVPALAGGGLLDLDPQRPAHLLQIARPPIVRAQGPIGLQRLRHHLLDQLAADGVAEERGAEQAVGQAGDEGGMHLGDCSLIAGGRQALLIMYCVPGIELCTRNCAELPGMGVPGIAGLYFGNLGPFRYPVLTCDRPGIFSISSATIIFRKMFFTLFSDPMKVTERAFELLISS